MDASYLQTCRYCKHEFRAAAKYLGRKVACPSCRSPVAVSDAVPVADKLVGRTIGGCTLQRRLGAGALGVVYEGVRQEDGRRVAIKLLSSQAAQIEDVVARFEREAALAMELRLPQIVAVHRCGQERGAWFLVMDYVDGGSLAARLDGEPLPWREAVALIRPIALALAGLHARGVIHRDIKPGNILIAGDGQPMLADLGLAKEYRNADANGLTMSNVALGSPAYMPPEQIRDARSVGPLADVYALGASLYECVTGRLPFLGANGAEVMAKVLRQPPPDAAAAVPGLPAGLLALLRSCMAKDPAERPQGAQALADALAGILADPDALPRQIPVPASRRASTVDLRPVRSAPPATASGGGGVPWWVWLVALAIIGGGGAGAWALLRL